MEIIKTLDCFVDSTKAVDLQEVSYRDDITTVFYRVIFHDSNRIQGGDLKRTRFELVDRDKAKSLFELLSSTVVKVRDISL